MRAIMREFGLVSGLRAVRAGLLGVRRADGNVKGSARVLLGRGENVRRAQVRAKDEPQNLLSRAVAYSYSYSHSLTLSLSHSLSLSLSLSLSYLVVPFALDQEGPPSPEDPTVLCGPNRPSSTSRLCPASPRDTASSDSVVVPCAERKRTVPPLVGRGRRPGPHHRRRQAADGRR